ncbi:MAG: polysaccharide pyruvyl transferase family protein, partial [Bacteroidales bacterium]
MKHLNVKYIPIADYTVVGSDQVWNRDITSYLSHAFFLNFANNKLVALSSSFGKKHWSDESEYTLLVNNLLERFQAISVREDSGVDILKNVFHIEGTQLLDPTLAYGKFTDFVKQDICKERIFCFIYNNSDNAKKIKQAISEKLHLPLKKENFFTRRLDASPINWLNNIYNSKFIITDSFHGVAFCLIFQKNFVVLCANKEKFTRLESLLKKMGLLNRIIHSIDELLANEEILLEPIDYNKVNCI